MDMPLVDTIDESLATPTSGLNQAALDLLWQRVHQQQDAAAREELICHHLPYARMVAATSYSKRYHDEIEFADYLQWSTLGMIEALDRFDPTQGTQFKTFASRRMQGAILDGVASASEKQEQISLRARLNRDRLNAAKQAADDAKEPSAPSSAPDKLLRYLADVGIGLALSWMLEDTGMVGTDEDAADARHIPYLQALELKQLQEQVRNLVETLAPQQKTVIRCHYVQEIPFEQIAAILGLSKGRIAQVHKQALAHLRQKIKGSRSCDVSW